MCDNGERVAKSGMMLIYDFRWLAVDVDVAGSEAASPGSEFSEF